MAPNVTYIVNGRGEKLFVQLSVEDWDKLMSERKRLLSEAKFKRTLKRAIDESEQVRLGKVKAISFDEFLDEL